MNVENREISQKLIDSIDELRKSINTISVYDFNIYSSMELYYTIANKLNELIKECYRYEVAVSDEIVKQNDCLQYLLNEGLNTEVVNKINNMVLDGTMDNIINTKLFNFINSQINEKASKRDLEVERKRIDSFTSLSEGSTTGDAELIDARIGANGVVYDNLGSANRGQFQYIDENINNYRKALNLKNSAKSINLFDKTTCVLDKYVNNETGEILNYSGWFASDYIKINSNESYLILKNPKDKYVDAQNAYYAFYDENKVYISGGILQSGSIVSPSTAKYIRLSLEESNRGYLIFGTKYNLINFYNKDKTYYVEHGYVSFERIDKLEEDIERLKEDGNFLPSYYKQHLESKIKDIQKKDLLYNMQGDTFAFITDTHIVENANNSTILLKEIVKNTNVNFILDGGDVLTQDSHDIAISQSREHIKDMVNKFGDKYKFTPGNHDDNRYLSSDKFLNNEVYSLYAKHLEESNVNEFYISDNKISYYFDNKKQKIRYICLDSNSGMINTNQSAWLANTALNFSESGWSVVIFTHWMFEENASGVNEFTNTASVDILSNILNAFINGGTYNRSDLGIDINYSNKQGNCCVIICGHTHKDDSMTTKDGIQVICTTCDCYGYGARVDKKGTYEEQAFDICHLDTKNKKLYMTRIGAGSNREFNL